MKKKRGTRKEYFEGKLIFDGEYSNRKRKGKGKEFDYYTGKIIFEGEFKNGIKWNGKGYNENNEIEYEIKDGYGNIKEYINGRLLYEGEYKNGKRNGKGKEYN